MNPKRWAATENLTGRFSDMLYIEWKYFNILSDDITAIFTYSLGNPRNIMGFGHGTITLAVYFKGRLITETVDIPLSECHVSDTGMDARFGHFTIVEDPDAVIIAGDGEKVSWNLRYRKRENLIRHHFDLGGFPYRKSWLDWLILMPHSWVTGHITLKETGESAQVNMPGYVDGNRGKWIPFQSTWQVLGVKTGTPKDIGIASMMIRNNPRKRILHMFFEDSSITFGADEFRVKNSEWRRDPKTGFMLPRRTMLAARSGQVRIKLDARALAADMIKLRMPLLSPNLYVFQIMSRMNLTMTDGSRTIFRGRRIGFNEITLCGYRR